MPRAGNIWDISNEYIINCTLSEDRKSASNNSTIWIACLITTDATISFCTSSKKDKPQGEVVCIHFSIPCQVKHFCLIWLFIYSPLALNVWWYTWLEPRVRRNQAFVIGTWWPSIYRMALGGLLTQDWSKSLQGCLRPQIIGHPALSALTHGFYGI